jgi:hypothetical protein
MFLRDAQNERLWFWQATFKAPDGGVVDEQAIKLYLEHGYRFDLPPTSILQPMLDALDADSGTWDLETPEYFFQTLEHNFPELLRNRIDREELTVLREIDGKPDKPS